MPLVGDLCPPRRSSTAGGFILIGRIVLSSLHANYPIIPNQLTCQSTLEPARLIWMQPNIALLIQAPQLLGCRGSRLIDLRTRFDDSFANTNTNFADDQVREHMAHRNLFRGRYTKVASRNLAASRPRACNACHFCSTVHLFIIFTHHRSRPLPNQLLKSTSISLLASKNLVTDQSPPPPPFFFYFAFLPDQQPSLMHMPTVESTHNAPPTDTGPSLL
jgi:hypothetical protein